MATKKTTQSTQTTQKKETSQVKMPNITENKNIKSTYVGKKIPKCELM